MEFCVYILYSEKLDSFYVGTTDDFESRLSDHNNGIKETSFTYRGIPWQKFLLIENLESKQAFAIEKKIKSMKSKIYIKNLKKYPEMILRLRNL